MEIRKDGRQYDGELRDHGKWGVEFQCLCNLEWFYGHRHESRNLALMEAEQRKAEYLRQGGILFVVTSSPPQTPPHG